jgi:toxin ParE1/3/4
MTNHKRFQLRPLAERDLERIYDYCLQEFGGARADQYIRDLDTAFHKLADNPSLAKNYTFVRSNLLAYQVVSHVVFFKLATNGITIVRVLHKSMDYGRHLK